MKKSQLVTFIVICLFANNSFSQPNLDWEASYSPSAVLGAEGFREKEVIFYFPERMTFLLLFPVEKGGF